MTDRNHGDFENAFDHAAHRIHRNMPRGDQPSARVWQAVLGESAIISEKTVEAAAVPESRPAPSLPRSTPRRSRFGSNVIPVRRGAHPDYLQWTSWVAVIAIVAAIGFGFYSMTQDEPGNRQQSVALAPSTPEINSSIEIASPTVLPTGYGYDPEFACSIEPISEEVVFQMVVNPFQFDTRYGYTPGSTPIPAKYGWETDGRYYDYSDSLRRQQDQMVAVEDPALRQQLVETADIFWNCLMTGSALQVWSLMDPIAVQKEVLAYLPTLRDEEMVRQFIREWGPRRYSAGLTMAFPDLGDVEQYDASKRADQSWEAVRMLYVNGDVPWVADVLMVPHPLSAVDRSIHLILTPAPDGRWWVSTFSGE